MNLEELETAALQLPMTERTRLVESLVLSLDSPSPEELASLWLDEAGRRAKELDDGVVETLPGHTVLAKARALVR